MDFDKEVDKNKIMQNINFEYGLDIMLDSLLNDRLALLAGAGLSMAPPSCLPSAAHIAAEAKRRYDATYGATRAPLAEGIEEQAEFFFQRGELDTIFIGSSRGSVHGETRKSVEKHEPHQVLRSCEAN
ncbi:hypothetical protein [Thiohalophilus sp.]|uniref:hypothetical protein n=1 Tax=Thiohalophilus sp. TaxID=3028392 RepID=UPI002ACD8BD0|nr:hypothetical protein [Thiohalophilus sp.]MDZ7802979.1 hypothetical protein [Thiohalophilus sp.]